MIGFLRKRRLAKLAGLKVRYEALSNWIEGTGEYSSYDKDELIELAQQIAELEVKLNYDR